MNIVEIKQAFQKALPEGFELSISSEGQVLVARKKNENRTIQSLLLANLDQLKVNNLTCFVTFSDVEDVLHPMNHPTNMQYTNSLKCHSFVFNIDPLIGIKEYFPLDLSDSSNLTRATELIAKFIRQDAQPFFDYWQDIRDFLPFLESEDIVFIANDLFSGNGMRKKMIIWWLCQHPRYNIFKGERLKVYEEALEKNPSDETKKKSYKDLISFLKRLEKTAPLYEWDDRYLIRKDGGGPT